ncbi:signal transduction histidine kinase [Elusimicrobium simillimum]|uniref:sensor histidine kinase n=1 Tax=Elusimicrobium simillimum TaxID=3143438 RepID=UPI003C6F547F
MENNKSVIYDMPLTVALAKDKKDLSKHVCEDCYELVYMLMADNKYAFIFGDGADGKPLDVDVNGPVHEKYHKDAIAGHKVVYEWSLNTKGGVKYYQSTLLPLIHEEGKPNVLGIVKDLSPAAYNISQSMVRDYGAKTFAQILIKTREDEKKKIASALHDEIGSTAVILTSILSILQEDLKENKTEDAIKRAGELDAKIKECIDRVKNLVVTMRPPSIDAVGLDGAVKELVENISKFANVKVVYNYREEDNGNIDDEVKIMLYRVVQESLNNALKHAKASRITVSLQNLENIVKIEVEDDGIGFKKGKQKKLSQIGLLGMEESVKYLGGKFDVQTALGKGTKISVSCPKVIYKVEI